MLTRTKELAFEPAGLGLDTGLGRFGALREGVLAKAAKFSGAVLSRERRRAFERFHTLGSAIIADGLQQPEARTGAYARVGTLLRDNIIFRGYVAEIPGQLAGNEVYPGVSTRHEVNVTVHSVSGAAGPGMMYTSKHEGHFRHTPVGEVVAAPIVDGAVAGKAWQEQRPLDLVPLDAFLASLSWGESLPIHPLDRDPFGPRFV